ncbi:MAG: hypothetical protein ACYC3I_18265 [Gemmataceae bacterium]
MECPACHANNDSQAVLCGACGGSLRANEKTAPADRPARRPNSRKRNAEVIEAAVQDSNNPAAWRAYRVSLLSVVPGFGLLLGPAAMILGYLAVRNAGDDLSASNRAKAAVAFGAGSTLTQWLGIALILYSF